MLKAVMLMMALAAPASAQQSESAQPAASAGLELTATMTRTSREEYTPIPYELVGGHILFKAKVAGRDVWMMLDNGSQHGIIDTALARSVGLAIEQLPGSVRTTTGTLPKMLVRDVAVTLPGQWNISTPLLAVDLESFSNLAGRKIEAVLGGDLLAYLLAVAVNSGRKTLQFAPSGSMTIPPRMPMVPINSKHQLEVRVGDQPVLVTLDLGLNGQLSLTPEAWNRVGPKDAELSTIATTGVDGQIHAVDQAQVPTVSIGAVKRQDVKVSIRPALAQDVDGVMGLGLLAGCDFVLDIKAGKLWLVPRLPSSVRSEPGGN